MSAGEKDRQPPLRFPQVPAAGLLPLTAPHERGWETRLTPLARPGALIPPQHLPTPSLDHKLLRAGSVSELRVPGLGRCSVKLLENNLRCRLKPAVSGAF